MKKRRKEGENLASRFGVTDDPWFEARPELCSTNRQIVV